MSSPQPKTIQQLSMSVPLAAAMLAGMQLDLFTPLHNRALTVEEIAELLGVGAPKLRPVLYALVAAGLLTVEDGRFSNSGEANQFLVRTHPQYMGAMHGSWANAWAAYLKTAETIRTGVPQAKLDWSSVPQDRLEPILRGLQVGASATGRALVEKFDFSAYHTLLDAGGGSGGLALTISELCPQLRATVVDLPNVTTITQRMVAEAGASQRVRVVTANVLRDRLDEKFDVAVMRHFIQVLSTADAQRAIMNISQAIEPGGLLLIVGMILDDSRLSPAVALAANLFFLNSFDEGQAYTEQEYRDWLSQAGFAQVERSLMPDGSSLIRAHTEA